MNRLTVVRPVDQLIQVFDVYEKRGFFTFQPPKQFTEPGELALYLTKKKKIYFLFSNDNVVEESITLPSVITNEATIESALNARIQDERGIHDKLILNCLGTSTDITGESATHRYEGLYEHEVLSAIAAIPNLEYLQQITTEPYALFALSEQIFQGRSYLCVYTSENKNLIVAVDDGVLLFYRTGVIAVENEIDRVAEQIRDISRTVAYAHQQFREVKFEFIALSGTIADAKAATVQLQMATRLNVTVLAPTLMVRGLDKYTAQNAILEIGSLYLPKTMNFLPDRVKAAHEFYRGSLIAVGVAFIFMLYALFQGLSAYHGYQESFDQYKLIESRLAQTLRHTDTLNERQLDEITEQLKSLTPLHEHFIDDLLPFENILNLLKPSTLTYDENNGSGTLVLKFKHQSNNLMDLYLFEKKFKHEVGAIKNVQFTPLYKTDYNALIFESTLEIGEKAQGVSR